MGNVYLAKVVFATNDEYSGSIVFSVEGGTPNLLWFNSSREFDILYNSEAATNTTKYLDYYDNIESFEKVFSSKEEYSINKTKYVIIKGAGEGFLIGDGVEAIFVSPKTVCYGELIEPKVLSVKKDLREMAQNDLNKYYMLKEEYEKWHKEHPDEKWDVDGYFPYELDFIDESKSLVSNEERNDISVISDDNENKVLDTDDISENKYKTDIVEKITTKEELVTNSQKDISEEKKTPQNSFGVIIVIGLAFVFFISAIVMYQKKQRKQ